MAWLGIRSMRRLAFGVAAGLAIAAGSTAQAQLGEAAGIAEAMQPEYLRRDIVLFDQILNLDESQRVIIGTLYEDYERSFEEGMKRMQARYEGMREELATLDERRVLTMVFAPLQEWDAEKRDLGELFLENVKVVLTDDQLSDWPSFRRRIVREKTMHLGRLSGEGTDLFHVINEMKLDERIKTQIKPVLEAYEIAIDQVLQRRNAAIARINPTMIEAMMDQDLTKSTTEMRRQIEMRIEVRRVNEEYRERIAESLPAELAAEFRTRALERAYPRIFRGTPIHEIFKAAKELPDLEPAVQQIVAGIEASYAAELAATNQILLEALKKHEPEDLLARTEQFHRRMQGETVTATVDPTRELFLKRDEMGRTYVQQLHAVVPLEQLQNIPGIHRFIDLPPLPTPEGELAPEKRQHLEMERQKAHEAEQGGEEPTKPDQAPPE